MNLKAAAYKLDLEKNIFYLYYFYRTPEFHWLALFILKE